MIRQIWEDGLLVAALRAIWWWATLFVRDDDMAAELAPAAAFAIVPGVVLAFSLAAGVVAFSHAAVAVVAFLLAPVWVALLCAM